MTIEPRADRFIRELAELKIPGVSVAFIEKTHGYNTRRLQSYVRSSADTIDFSGYPHIDQFIMTGPFHPTGSGETPSRRAISARSMSR